jgi:hypothetical protein
MKTTRWVVIAALAAAGVLFAVADTMAQYGGGTTGGGRRGARMEKGANPGMDRPTVQESVVSLVEFRLALLQEDLKLTREQERSWLNYEERTKALAADISREQTRARSAMSMSAMQQVSHEVDTARDRLTAWEEIASAAKALYGSLTPEQRMLANARMPSVISALTPGRTAGSVTRPEGPAAKQGPGWSPGRETK